MALPGLALLLPPLLGLLLPRGAGAGPPPVLGDAYRELCRWVAGGRRRLSVSVCPGRGRAEARGAGPLWLGAAPGAGPGPCPGLCGLQRPCPTPACQWQEGEGCGGGQVLCCL